MEIKKDKIFAMTAAFDIIKSAMKQIVRPNKNTDRIIFNSLIKTIRNKKQESK